MNCSCIRGKGYNFFIKVPDNQNIIYVDLSDWMIDDTHSIPNNYEIEILLPGAKAGKEILVNTIGSRITAKDLGLSCLIDGFYKFKVFTCGTNLYKFAAILPNTYCCYKKYISTEGINEKSREMRRLFDSIKINVELQDVDSANSNFKLLKTLMATVACDCGC